MRLLNVRTRMLEEYFDDAIHLHPYAILSHTWGPNEVLYSHIQEKGYQGGSKKVDGCIQQAVEDGYSYVWIDTCCIDKSSSAELSEAINSMYRWYEMAQVCYAYLEDVPDGVDPYVPGSAFRRSRWFTRGWTLQELLAPRRVEFFSGSWLPVIKEEKVDEGRRIQSLVTEIAGVPAWCVTLGQERGFHAERFRTSIAQKMSWAAGRSTTRLEDRAYSLLGIFGVNMPLLYGEGERAFIRLQEEIMKNSDDLSLFAWGYGEPTNDMPGGPGGPGGLFATSPDDFINAGNIVATKTEHHYAMTNKGLLVNLRVTDYLQSKWSLYAPLSCNDLDGSGSERSIWLPLVSDGRSFYRDTSRTAENMHIPFQYIRPDGEPRYISRDPLPLLNFGMVRPGFSLSQHGLDVRAGITECYPERWTSALKKDCTVPRISAGPAMIEAEDILFCYGGGQIPRFIAKLRYQFSFRTIWTTAWQSANEACMVPRHMECSLAWLSEHPHIPTLESLIAHHAAPGLCWSDALDDVLNWQPDLSLDDGTTLSVEALLKPGIPPLSDEFELCFKLQTANSDTRQQSSIRSE